MNRILEFSPSQEEAVVSRILVLVHQAIDEAFPSTENANRRFTKTVFSDDGGEKTAALRPGDQFSTAEETSPGGQTNPGSAPAVPPPPPNRSASPPPTPTAKSKAQEAASKPIATAESPNPLPANSPLNPMAGTRNPSRSTRLDSHMERMGVNEGPDWVTRITLALLIAGVMLLAYVLFA